jgi:hypothetical protein
MIDFLVGIVGFCIVVGGIFIFFHRKKKLNPALCHTTIENIMKTQTLDPAHALMESHKLFVSALRTLFPKAKIHAAQVIQYTCKSFPNKQTVWNFHRLRNKVAHEPGTNISHTQAHKARQAFVYALQSLLFRNTD